MDYLRTHKKIAVATLVVVLAIVFVVLFKSAIYHQISDLKLSPKKETFTELYFNDPEHLPKAAAKGEEIEFFFTIHNVEGVQTVYPYVVYFLHTDGRKTLITKNTITLDDGASKSIDVTHTFTSANEQGQIVVSLTNLNQTIDFLIPNNN